MNKADFVEVLLRASKTGYSSPNAVVKDQPDGAYEIIYEENKWLFIDYWFGGNPFSGQESVSYAGKAMWAMQYRGGVPENASVAHEEVFSFLKKALAQCSADEPLRGPAEFAEDGWYYTNTWSHDLSEFTGHEEITYKGEIVHITDYFGGLVDGASFEGDL